MIEVIENRDGTFDIERDRRAVAYSLEEHVVDAWLSGAVEDGEDVFRVALDGYRERMDISRLRRSRR